MSSRSPSPSTRGADALCSLLPLGWHAYKLEFAVIVVLLMILLNMRGAKESVVPLVLIFLTLLITQVLIVLYAVAMHIPNLGGLVSATRADVSGAVSEVGFRGFVFLLLKSYSMGAGTYTGIEAVSNGMPILREPKAATAKRTMLYMAVSLAFVAGGLMLAYLVYGVDAVPGKTLNAIPFSKGDAGLAFESEYYVYPCGAGIGSDPPFCGGADGLSRWAESAGEHGAGPVVPCEVLRPE